MFRSTFIAIAPKNAVSFKSLLSSGEIHNIKRMVANGIQLKNKGVVGNELVKKDEFKGSNLEEIPIKKSIINKQSEITLILQNNRQFLGFKGLYLNEELNLVCVALTAFNTF